MNVFDGTSLFCSPTSPCTSLSSLPWSDSEPSPTPCRFSNDVISRVPSVTPPVPQTALPAPTQTLEAPARPPGSERPLPTPPVQDPTRQAVLGRRAPKQRRITRAVQPLACYFCRGRKIACGPPADLGSGNRTCEYVVTHRYTHPHTLFFSKAPCTFLFGSPQSSTTIHVPARFLSFLISRRHGSAPFSNFVLCVWAHADNFVLPFWYGLGHVRDDVSFANFPQSHTVAVVHLGQRRHL
jgi:hypothetical protein